LAGQYAKEGDKEKEEFYDRRQKREKVFLNSIYGSTGMVGGRWYNVVNAEAVTTSGQAIIQSGERLVNTIINNALNTPETDDRVVAIDTDSVTGDCKISPNGIEQTIDNTWDTMDTTSEIVDITGRRFKFPTDMELPYYDEQTNGVKYGKVKYIEKHKTKKRVFLIKTKSGKSIKVTEDHSIMVLNDKNEVIKKLSKDLNKNDKLISISIKIDEIEEIIELGDSDEYFYDIGMVDTPHTFFANGILVHNSLYFSLNALMENDKTNEDDKVKYSIDKLTYIANKINVMYNHMLPIVFNVPVDQNRIKIIPDVVAKRAIWLGKKRYSLLKVFDMEKMKSIKDKVGNEGKIEHKGVDVIRSSFPYSFQKMLGGVLENVLRDKAFELVDVDVMEFEESIKNITPINLSAGTSVKWVSRKGDKQYNPKGRVPFSIVKGSPISVKAALAHNDILKSLNLDTQFRPFMAGEKVKWMYLVDCNPYAVEVLAFRGDDSDSDVVLNILNEYGDKEKMYVRVLKNKLLKIYVAMKRNFPNRGSLQAAKAFNFEETW
jgi:hypothetical protein